MQTPTFRIRSSFFLLACSALIGCAALQGPTQPSLETQAKAFLDDKRPEQALPLLERLHRERPRDLEIARELVDAHVRTGQTDALLVRLEKDTAAQPTASGFYMLGLAQFARNETAVGAAQQSFERAIALAPKEGEISFRLGLALLESEHDKEALAPLERAAVLEPQRTRVRLPLAKARLRAADREGAIRELRTWLDGHPAPSEVATARSLMSEISDPFAGMPQAARGQLETGINWLQSADVPQQAIVTFEEILHDFPDLAVVHGLLGLAYERLEDIGRAVDEFHRAIELDPLQAQPYQYLGELYLTRQRPQQGRESLEKALERNPLLDTAYLRLGDLAMERQEVDVARRNFERLTSLLPDDASAHGKFATALEVSNDLDGADRELKRALALEPETLEFTARLGLLHAERFRHATKPDDKRAERAQAQKYLQEVLARQPENAIASRTLEALRE